VETFPIYLFIFIVFLNRYVFGLYLTIIRRKTLDETIEGYEPTVTVVVPLYDDFGRTLAALAVCRDVTDSKRLEEYRRRETNP